MIDRLGQQLGNYRLLRLLGQGGQASVYLGEHLYLKSQAALKVRHTALTQEEQTVFLQEAQTLVRLTHPHIVRVLDFALQDSLPFLVMEYAAGGTLRQRHPRGTRLPLDRVLPYVKQVASALQYTHDQHLIHRDVKPENMLLNSHDVVLLSDFGLVLLLPQSLSPEGTELMEQSLVGTTPYLAPEQLRGKAQPSSDQYALAVVVYEWLSGKPPFHGPFLEVAVQQVSVPPPSLCEQVPDLSPNIEAVVLRALAKEAEQRFPSVKDFAQALEEAYRPETSSRPSLPALSSYRSSEARQARKHKLPAQPTPFIGREQEVARACELLSRSEVRLLTLSGPGGIGKTRLSLQVAAVLSDHFVDGIYFVNLAPLRDPELVVPTIAQTLEVKESGARPIQEQLHAFLEEKQVLLMLDNFEQVVVAAPRLSDLLAACPHLKLLVTSRQVLRLSAEHEFAVPPLALPDLKHLPDLVTLSQYEAVALFIQRAQAVKPDFQVSTAAAPAVAEICARLDGLPLAIELAAARIKLLPPLALLARLGQRLVVLTGSVRDAPARQHTLRNTIDWSYQLLDVDEQRLFRRLSVFVGGCTLEALEAISDELVDGNAPSVLDGVASLLDKSLLRQSEQEGEEPRFQMLETIREYGLETLSAKGEAEITRQMHASYYLALAEKAELDWVGPREAGWFARMEQEHDNLRAAMSWQLERREAEMVLRLSTAVWGFWLFSGYYHEGWNFLEHALAGSEEVAVPVRAKALYAAGNLAAQLGYFEQGEALCKESLALAKQIGDRAGMSYAVFHLAEVAFERNDFATARSLFEESLELAKPIGDVIPWVLVELASVTFIQGEYARAYSLAQEGLTLFRDLGNTFGVAYSLGWLANALFVQGDLEQARALAEKCLTLYKEAGTKETEADALDLLGELILHRGDTTTARMLVEQSCALRWEVGNEKRIMGTFSLLGKVLAAQGDYAGARVLYEKSLTRGKGVSSNLPTLNIASALEGLAAVVAAQEELSWAARLWGAAEALRDTMGAPLPPIYRADYEQAVAAVRTQLGEPAFAAARAEGRSMTLEQVLAAREPVTMPIPVLETQLASHPAEKSPTTYPDGLTAREVEVLRLVAQGLSNAQIAEQLIISLLTVKAHMRSLYNKLGISSRSAATRYAIEHKLVS